MSEFIKLYEGVDGGKIVEAAAPDPQAEFPYTDKATYDTELVEQIATLQITIDSFSNGESNQQMIVNDDKYPEDVQANIDKHNSDIGYTAALNELTEKQELLECLRNG